MEAAPRPWAILRNAYRDIFIVDSDGECVASIEGLDKGYAESEADAELIVRAGNSYEALVEALAAYVAAEVPEMQSEHFQERVKAAGPRGAAVVAAYHKARAALAAARGEIPGVTDDLEFMAGVNRSLEAEARGEKGKTLDEIKAEMAAARGESEVGA